MLSRQRGAGQPGGNISASTDPNGNCSGDDFGYFCLKAEYFYYTNLILFLEKL